MDLLLGDEVPPLPALADSDERGAIGEKRCQPPPLLPPSRAPAEELTLDGLSLDDRSLDVLSFDDL
jgi:hypothetical protein